MKFAHLVPEASLEASAMKTSDVARCSDILVDSGDPYCGLLD